MRVSYCHFAFFDHILSSLHKLMLLKAEIKL